ncbi:uncharacterized protein LOC132727429, partial [Ruditapes philippinarum]|uniref:uncharacterized protein LOC132727429 n=1 Tax=Ruditapes philippinarum TaxID=129788 RepID=UPI00295BD710
MDISTPKQNILNRQFQSVFTDNITVTADDFKKGNYINPQSTHPVAPEISITTRGIRKLLLALNPHKAARPDTTSPSILKDLAIDIAPILTTILDLELNRLECIWIELILCNNRHILFSIFYRPPNSDVIYNNLIEDSIGLAIDTNIPDIIITGDFNLNVNCYSSNRKITSITQQFNLEQLIDEPTHYTEHSNSLIDLILVSNKSNVIHSGVGDHFLEQELRYHVPIFGFLKFRKPRQMCFDRIVWEYEHADYEALREDINTYTWENCFDADVNIYANNVINQIQTIAKNNIPNKLIKVRPLDVPWMTNSIRVNIRKRKRLYKKARMTNSQYYWQRFKSIRNETILLIREAKSNYFCKLSNKLKNESLSSKDWWKTLKSFISSTNNSSIPPLTDPLNRNIVYSNNDKANLLNNFFVEQMSINDENRDPLYLSSPLSCLNDIVLSPHEVKDVLLSLQVDKAVGPDGISNRILREASHELSSPLCDLFNASLRCCKVPITWKEANVTAVHKKGDTSLPNNYRPISLLNTTEKVFERLVLKHIFNFLKVNNFLSTAQSGFIPGDSTVNQLAFIYDTLCRSLDNGLEVRVVFFDISKAFDKADTGRCSFAGFILSHPGTTGLHQGSTVALLTQTGDDPGYYIASKSYGRALVNATEP